MSRIFKISILASLLLASPAYAYEIRANPADTATLEASMERLPNCVMIPAMSKFKRVTVMKPKALNELVGAVHLQRDWNIWAISYKNMGLTMIDKRVVGQPNIIDHEMGHWFYWTHVFPEYGAAWNQAIKMDYADLSAEDKDAEVYLKDPEETFAESFAKLYDPKFEDEPHHFHPEKMKRAAAMFDGIISEACH